MAETVESDHNASFWLPTHFLTDEDFLPQNDDPNMKKKHNQKDFDLLSGGFSGGFDPFGLPSVLDSPVSSSETEPERDDQELLAELTRQLAQSSLRETTFTHEKPWLFSTSPQSTLNGLGPWTSRSGGLSSNGSPNGPSQSASPPLTPPGTKNDAAWDLLYEAAGQVARLKMNAFAAAAQMNHHHNNHQQQQQRVQVQNRGGGFLRVDPTKSSPHASSNCFYDFSNENQFPAVKRQSSEWYSHPHNHPRRSSGGGALGLSQSAWPPLSGGSVQPHHHNHHRQQNGGPAPAGMRTVFLGGSGSAPRKSAGTGVFLPRRPGTQQQPEPRRKPTGGAPVLLPARVVHALNLNPDGMNTRFGCGFVTDHDMLMARRNSQMVGQQRSLRSINGGATMAMGGHHEVSLPSDWTY